MEDSLVSFRDQLIWYKNKIDNAQSHLQNLWIDIKNVCSLNLLFYLEKQNNICNSNNILLQKMINVSSDHS
jgi:hypothetical protein